MNKTHLIFAISVFAFLITSCQQTQAITPTEATTVDATASFTLEPTNVPTETNTPEPTLTPSPTSLPGSQVISIDSMAQEIPWLPMPNNGTPGINFAAFNMKKPPFDNTLIRQAFSYAINREAITEMAVKYHAKNARPATVFTPPEVLGRDLYGEVGINYDPQKAKELFAEAGYSDPSSFPTVTYLVNASGETAPGMYLNIANAMADMWMETLGVSVNVEIMGNWGAYLDRLATNPPEIYRLGWAADYNDPDNFLREVFHSSSDINRGHFSNDEFDRLVFLASHITNPIERQRLYIQAERILCEEEVALIPLFFGTY